MREALYPNPNYKPNVDRADLEEVSHVREALYPNPNYKPNADRADLEEVAHVREALFTHTRSVSAQGCERPAFRSGVRCLGEWERL